MNLSMGMGKDFRITERWLRLEGTFTNLPTIPTCRSRYEYHRCNFRRCDHSPRGETAEAIASARFPCGLNSSRAATHPRDDQCRPSTSSPNFGSDLVPLNVLTGISAPPWSFLKNGEATFSSNDTHRESTIFDRGTLVRTFP